jgi:N-acetylglucosaminyldiphosphoundecaprenol N-acetyl-beta-D-mannosaminyltransferase
LNGEKVKEIERILGYDVATLTRERCLERIMGWIESGDRGRYFVCANPHSLEVARRDDEFRRAIREADLVTPDGAGILLASKILKGAIRERVTGSDIFLGLLALMDEAGRAGRNKSCFFLGSTDDNLREIERRMARMFPRVAVAGAYSPPFVREFSDGENDRMVEMINAARPDVLWVGMTAPKQEKWVYRNRGRLDVKFIGPVGAVFDFFTGRVKRSHPAFQVLGLEWLPRLLREPRRLWRRNFVSNPAFVMRVVGEAVKRRGGEGKDSSE